MFQFTITQFILIAVIIFTWTVTSLCACHIMEDLLENIQAIKRELSELKASLKNDAKETDTNTKTKTNTSIIDEVHIKTA